MRPELLPMMFLVSDWFFSISLFLLIMSSFLFGVLKYIGSSILYAWLTLSGRSLSFCKLRSLKPFKFSSASVLEFNIPAGIGFCDLVGDEPIIKLAAPPAPGMLSFYFVDWPPKD